TIKPIVKPKPRKRSHLSRYGCEAHTPCSEIGERLHGPPFGAALGGGGPLGETGGRRGRPRAPGRQERDQENQRGLFADPQHRRGTRPIIVRIVIISPFLYPHSSPRRR